MKTALLAVGIVVGCIAIITSQFSTTPVGHKFAAIGVCISGAAITAALLTKKA